MGAAKALAHIGKAATPALIETLKHENNSIRATGAEALAEIGPDAAAAAPALADALSDKDATVRSRAATALERIGSGIGRALSSEGDSKCEWSHASIGHSRPRFDR